MKFKSRIDVNYFVGHSSKVRWFYREFFFCYDGEVTHVAFTPHRICPMLFCILKVFFCFWNIFKHFLSFSCFLFIYLYPMLFNIIFLPFLSIEVATNFLPSSKWEIPAELSCLFAFCNQNWAKRWTQNSYWKVQFFFRFKFFWMVGKKITFSWRQVFKIMDFKYYIVER